MDTSSEAKDPWRGWLIAGLPFVLSLGLSLSTVGTHPYWQDSGLYLTAVHEFGVLYPPGFVLYLLLCKLWTLAFFFVDFTLAVHLFSSFCAALAAGTMAVAVRDLLRSRGRIFRVTEEDPGPAAAACGIFSGCLLATGYTFWFTGIYAKGYSLYYLILALLLRRMIRADGTGRPRDFIVAAALMGLAWQAHPSAGLAGLGMALFALAHRRTLGWARIGLGLVAAAACALGPALLMLPLLVSREPWLMFGEPRSFGELLGHVSGRRFLVTPGAFGWEASRGASFGRFLWEEMLGVGLCFVAVGLAVLVRSNRRLLLGLLAWLVPYALVTILFKPEGQHDCWFVASWLPLYLAMGVGAWKVARWSAGRARWVLAGAGIAGAAWAAIVNHPLLDQRNYTLSELYGRAILETVDPDSILLLGGDDPNALCGYLQRVRGDRPDVLLVTAPFLFGGSMGGRDWYDELLLKRHPFLRRPDYQGLWGRFPRTDVNDVAAAEFMNANARCGRPIFCERVLPTWLLRDDFILVPAGVIWKLVPRGREPAVELRYWKFPIEPEEIRSTGRRERGQIVQHASGSVIVKPQAYERRLLRLLLRARLRLARALVERGQFVPAISLCDSILALDPEDGENPELIHTLAVACHGAGDRARAEPLLRKSAELNANPYWRATALLHLGGLARSRGAEAEARLYFEQALATPGLDEVYRREMESRIKPR